MLGATSPLLTERAKKLLTQPRDGLQRKVKKKRAVVNAEIDRVNKLPANSSYATHRMRVLNKILQLMSIQRRRLSQDEELELLFAGLSL